MGVLRELTSYEDEHGNSVRYEGVSLPNAKVSITFQGKNNQLVIHAGAKIVELTVIFAGDGGLAEIGSTVKPRTGLRFAMRLGHASTVTIGEDVGCETRTFICVSEGQRVRIGRDCMIATAVELRADDSHAIYDVGFGRRVNPARSIDVGDHVWLGKSVAVMAGASIGDGSVIGYRSIVTKKIPNNCVAVGAPARVVRRNVAWERPLLAAREPGVPGLPEGHAKSEAWWQETEVDEELQSEAATPTVQQRRRWWSRRAQAA